MLNQPGLRNINLQKVRLLDRLAAAKPELANELRALKLDWYTIRNQSSEESTDVFIYDEIGGSMGVQASTFVEELNEITTPEIVVRINSPGGLLIDGIAIANAFAQHASRITTRVDGIAASAASIIFAAGDVREVMDGSQTMIHDAMVNFSGNPAQLRETLDWLEDQSENVAGIYARKAGGTKAEWRARMQAETWLFAEETVEIGLANKIFESTKAQAPDEPDEDDDAEESTDAALNGAIKLLMARQHRMTNRGYRFSSRNNAPAPEIQLAKALASALPQPLKNAKDAPLTAEEIEKFATAMAQLKTGR